MTSYDVSESPDERETRRHRNSVALVAVAAVLCVVGAVLAVVSLTGGGGEPIEPAGGAPSVSAAPAPSSSAPAESAPDATGPPAGGDTVTFSSPSGNIGCALDSAGARCDIASHDWEATPKPETCTATWGQGVVVGPEGSGYVCAGDSKVGATTVLEYGSVAERGTVRCASEETGMRCEDSATGHGFEVARATVELF
ncbi:MAG TPA: DUF6636 domain-containing protein [Actinomycetales bacterium]|nr:DUF6636 domain-containing protein [Actinomycetales bacterium]